MSLVNPGNPKFIELPEDIQKQIRDKARWEHMTLSAVIDEWKSYWQEWWNENGESIRRRRGE
jgi:hypothetical protein